MYGESKNTKNHNLTAQPKKNLCQTSGAGLPILYIAKNATI
jgi:hypothetical protein